jgi:hypothetical protein
VACTLILSKTGVMLGLVGDAAIPDPHRLLACRARLAHDRGK